MLPDTLTVSCRLRSSTDEVSRGCRRKALATQSHLQISKAQNLHPACCPPLEPEFGVMESIVSSCLGGFDTLRHSSFCVARSRSLAVGSISALHRPFKPPRR